LGELVQKREELLRNAKELLAGGVIAQAEVDQAEKRLVEARLRVEASDRESSANQGVFVLQFDPGFYSEKIREFGVIVQIRDAKSGKHRPTVVKPGQKVSTTAEPGEYVLEINEAAALELSRTRVNLERKGEVAIALRPRPATIVTARLEGRWLAVSAEYQGRKIPEDEAKTKFPTEIVIKKTGQYGITWGAHQHEGTLTADGSKEPAEIDFSGSVFGDQKPRKVIYKLDGDTLILCLPYVGTTADPPRPTEFKTDPQSKNAVLTYRRAD
jgi:uncharacterized protein (TIGR03067 family)